MYSTIATILSLASIALAQKTYNVSVGPGLVYIPPALEGVSGGDIIKFVFVQGNHTVTQSTFADPCTSVPNGQDSGYLPFVVPAPPPVWDMTVPNDLSGPLWFYCAQEIPGNHCHAGMVFAINPTADQTYAAFREAAIALGSSSTSPSSSSGTPTSSASGGSASSSGSSGGTPTSSASGENASSSAPSSSGSTSATSSSNGASSASASGTSVGDSTSPSPTNGAMSAKVGAASVLLSGVGILASLML